MDAFGIVFGVLVLVGAILGITFALRSATAEKEESPRLAEEEAAQAPTAPAPAPAYVPPPPTPLAQISGASLFWIIFGALWAYTATAAIVYAILRALIDAAPQ